VLSVMNGFQKEVRDRMLGVISHIEVFAPGGSALPDVARTLAEVRKNPQVVGAAPFIAAQALLARGEDMKGTLVRGIDPVLEGGVSELGAQLKASVFPKLVSGEFGVVLMMGGNIPGQTRVLSTQIYGHVEAMAYTQAHVLAAGMLVFSFAVLLGLNLLQKRGLRMGS